MKTIMSCLALVALAVFTSAAFAQEPAPAQQPAAAQEPTLTSAEAKFDTTTDNKDQQTKLDVYVKTSDGHEIAKAEGNEGRWNKNSTHTVTLQVEGNPTKGEVADGTVTLTLHPQRRNKWSFNYKVTLKFSDDTFITKDFKGCYLTEHDPARTDSFK
jgi:methionine-rich copper-binding protein CopC